MATEATRAKVFAERLLADTEELGSYLNSISEAQWQTTRPDEGWPLTLTPCDAAEADEVTL